jgi:hypothetical protein
MTNFAIEKLKFSDSTEELIELSENEQKQILGGDCYYAGDRYSTGSTVTQGSKGVDKTCMANGTWQLQTYTVVNK